MRRRGEPLRPAMRGASSQNSDFTRNRREVDHVAALLERSLRGCIRGGTRDVRGRPPWALALSNLDHRVRPPVHEKRHLEPGSIHVLLNGVSDPNPVR